MSSGSARHINLDSAKEDKLFYFIANVVVYREEDGRCLILKRHEREAAHPGKYAVPGGKLEWSQLDLDNPSRLNGDVLDFEDAVEDVLEREAREEAGIEIERDLHYINSVAFVRPDGIPSVLVKFAARYMGGDVVLEEGDFTDYVWVNADEVRNYPCIDGVPEEIAQTVEILGR